MTLDTIPTHRCPSAASRLSLPEGTDPQHTAQHISLPFTNIYNSNIYIYIYTFLLPFHLPPLQSGSRTRAVSTADQVVRESAATRTAVPCMREGIEATPVSTFISTLLFGCLRPSLSSAHRLTLAAEGISASSYAVRAPGPVACSRQVPVPVQVQWQLCHPTSLIVTTLLRYNHGPCDDVTDADV